MIITQSNNGELRDVALSRHEELKKSGWAFFSSERRFKAPKLATMQGKYHTQKWLEKYGWQAYVSCSCAL
jgi:hypothetical protein